uniref:J domain-containing protein n=1 Tax=Opuntia streptacantha TaxID=393608 RepID=A0A7C9D6E7_OPUST
MEGFLELLEMMVSLCQDLLGELKEKAKSSSSASMPRFWVLRVGLPVSPTDLVRPAAVRKAYKKANLCVHPDKLQQHGTTIQQEYICEKVFDLLKEAWSRFNPDER